ncbi:hypothetical protein N1851_015665 [Merluccius polli]|uniref:Secreted protein n=1 Tax=Merluccius polli TaxID=89951 RepID=A0AA47MSL3_MERPO|nr:hypothetical protein N1851_015665 [Merluccius polli]
MLLLLLLVVGVGSRLILALSGSSLPSRVCPSWAARSCTMGGQSEVRERSHQAQLCCCCGQPARFSVYCNNCNILSSRLGSNQCVSVDRKTLLVLEGCYFSAKDGKRMVSSYVACGRLLSFTTKSLQLVQTAAARLLTRTCDHITPILASLHWLPITVRSWPSTNPCIKKETSRTQSVSYRACGPVCLLLLVDIRSSLHQDRDDVMVSGHYGNHQDGTPLTVLTHRELLHHDHAAPPPRARLLQQQTVLQNKTSAPLLESVSMMWGFWVVWRLGFWRAAGCVLPANQNITVQNQEGHSVDQNHQDDKLTWVSDRQIGQTDRQTDRLTDRLTWVTWASGSSSWKLSLRLTSYSSSLITADTIWGDQELATGSAVGVVLGVGAQNRPTVWVCRSAVGWALVRVGVACDVLWEESVERRGRQVTLLEAKGPEERYEGASPRPCGGASPRPCGGASPRPCGGASPRPCGGASPRLCGGASNMRPQAEQPHLVTATALRETFPGGRRRALLYLMVELSPPPRRPPRLGTAAVQGVAVSTSCLALPRPGARRGMMRGAATEPAVMADKG